MQKMANGEKESKRLEPSFMMTYEARSSTVIAAAVGWKQALRKKCRKTSQLLFWLLARKNPWRMIKNKAIERERESPLCVLKWARVCVCEKGWEKERLEVDYGRSERHAGDTKGIAEKKYQRRRRRIMTYITPANNNPLSKVDLNCVRG